MKVRVTKTLVALFLVVTMLTSAIFSGSKVMAAEPAGVTLDFVEVTSSNTFKFIGTLADGSAMAKGYYKVLATIVHDSGSVTKDILMEVGNNGAISIWNSFFQYNNSAANTPPTKSLTFAKDAVVTEVKSSGGWSVVENGNTYKLSAEVKIEKGQDGNWSKVLAGVTLDFVEVTSSNTFKFTGTLADGSAMAKGYYKVLATIVHDSGSVTKDILMEVGNNGAISIWNSFFQYNNSASNTPPTKSLTFAKDAVVTEVKSSGGWSVVENGNTYMLSAEMKVEKGQDGVWKKVVPQVEPEGITLQFVDVTSSNTFKFVGTLADSSKIPNGYYKVPATIVNDTGSVTKDITIEVGNNGAISIWSNFFHFGPGNHATLPTKSFTIAKDAVFTEVQIVSNVWSVKENGKTYKLSEEMSIYKGQNSVWSVGTLPVEPAGITLEFAEVTSSNTFKFVGTLADSSKMPNGYYKVPATIVNDTGSVTKDITIEVGNNGAISIWSNFFHFGPGNHATLPTKSFTIAKDAVFTEVQIVSNVWSVKENGKTYKLSEEMSICKGQNGVWSVGTLPVEPASVTLEFVTVDENNTFKFTGKLADASSMPKGYYKVPATIVHNSGSVTKDILVEVGNNGAISIWNGFFQYNNAAANTPPTKSLTFAKDAVFVEVKNAGSWSIVENGKTYKLSEEIIVSKGTNGIWSEGALPVELTGVTLTFVEVTGSNTFKFTGKLEDASNMPKGYYKVQATIVNNTGSVTKDITIEVGNNGAISIWSSFFQWNDAANSTVPTKSLTFAKDAVFAEAVHTGGRFQVVENGKAYKLTDKICIVNEDGWILEGTKPVVPEIPDDIDSVDVIFNRVDSSNNFNFDWALTNGKEAGKGFYSATIKVDGVDRKVLLEGTGKGIWIYYHCFTLPPNGANPQIPKETVVIPKGTVFTPVVQNKWTTVRTDGEYYKVNNEVSIKNYGGVWIPANQNTEDPLEVYIYFKEVKRGALYLTVKTANGKDISEIYGKNWPSASGMIIRGIADDNNQFTYTKVSTQYNIVTKALYLGALSLRQLDEVKIEAGTILFPGADAESQRPIKLLNSFRMTRNEKDQWVADGASQEPGSNSGPSGSGTSTSPQTGDVRTTVAWVVLMSCAGLSMILLNKKRREKTLG